MNMCWSVRSWVVSIVLLFWALGAYSGYRARCVSTSLFDAVVDEAGRDLGLICGKLHVTFEEAPFAAFRSLGHDTRQALKSLDRLKWDEQLSSKDSFHLVIDHQKPDLLAAVGSELRVGVGLLLDPPEFEYAVTQMLRALVTNRSRAKPAAIDSP